MHSAVALSTTCTWDSSPSPASLPETVRVLPDRETLVAVLMKCGLPAHATGQQQPPRPAPTPPTVTIDASEPPSNARSEPQSRARSPFRDAHRSGPEPWKYPQPPFSSSQERGLKLCTERGRLGGRSHGQASPAGLFAKVTSVARLQRRHPEDFMAGEQPGVAGRSRSDPRWCGHPVAFRVRAGNGYESLHASV